MSSNPTNERRYYSAEYQGKLGSYQVYGSSFKPEYQRFNTYQKMLYNRAIYGVMCYSPQEREKLPASTKRRIQYRHKRAKRVLNLWKQELIIKMSNHLFETIFPRMPITKEFLEMPVDPMYDCDISFKDLGIKVEDVVEKLIKEEVLPKNFYNLKVAA